MHNRPERSLEPSYTHMNNSEYTSVTMLTGNMRCHTHMKGGHSSCITDVPASIGGKGEYPTPAAMLAATLASCMMSMLAFTGKRKGFTTDGISAKAVCHEDKQGIRAFEIKISVPMAPPVDIRKMMEAAVRSCPVSNALHPNIGKNILWIYADDVHPA